MIGYDAAAVVVHVKLYGPCMQDVDEFKPYAWSKSVDFGRRFS